MKEKLKNEIKAFFSWKFVKFLLTGGFNTVMGFAIYSGFYYLTHNEFVSLLLNYIIGIVINYFTYSKVVFDIHNFSFFFKFIGVYVIIYAINLCALKLCINVLAINPYLSQLMTMVIIVPLLFISLRKLVYRND